MLKVLFVDDEAAVLIGLEVIIDWKALGCKIVGKATNGKEALQMMPYCSPDIVLTDIRMPEIDGLELAKIIAIQYPRTKVIIVTGFADFDYARQAIQYRVVDFILKPTRSEKLIEALENAKKQILSDDSYQSLHDTLAIRVEENLFLKQKLLLSELIYGTGQPIDNDTLFAECNLSINGFWILRIAPYSVLSSSCFQECLAQIRKIMEDCFFPQKVYFVSRTDRYLYCILCAAEEYDVMAPCLKIVEIIDHIADYQVKMGISRFSDQLGSMSQTAAEAKAALQFAEYEVNAGIMKYDDIPKLDQESAKWIANQIKFVEAAVEARSTKMVERYFSALFAFMYSQKIPVSEMKRVGAMLINYGVGVIYSYNLQEKLDLKQLLTLESFFNLQSVPEMTEQLEHFLFDVVELLSTELNQADTIVQTVKTLIRKNYATDLSLESLAEQVHVSSSYLSKLFKRTEHVNLISYLQEVRIDAAKILLKTTRLRTYEIAEQIGIGDPVYFSRIFKKHTGLKPSEFRADRS